MNVAVTGVHSGCQRSPGLAVGRSLARCQEVSVTAVDYDELATGLQAPEFSYVVVLPWTSDAAILVERLRPTLAQHSCKVILPCLNTDVLLLAAVADKLKELGVETLLPSMVALDMIAKPHLADGAKDFGLLHPRTIVCKSEDEIEVARSLLGLPCVVKGRDCGVFPVRNAELFNHYVAYCTRCFDFPILVQEWIEGEEFSVMGLCNRDSRLILSVAVKKVGIGDDGECWMSVVVERPELIEALEFIVTATRWIGPIECDFVFNENGLYLLECNPRFPAWVDGPAAFGFNAPLEAVHLASGADPGNLRPVPCGTVFYKDVEDLCLPVSCCTTAWV